MHNFFVAFVTALVAATSAFAHDASRLSERVNEFFVPGSASISYARVQHATLPAIVGKVLAETRTTAPTTPQSTTVITQPVIERVIESVRTITAPNPDATSFDARMSALERALSDRINVVASAASSRSDTLNATIGMVGRIEHLFNLWLTDPTITGASITGGSISNAAISATSLTVSGNLTVSGTQTLSGAITIPYLTATSSTASSFAGSLGIGTTTPWANLSISGLSGQASTSPLFVLASSTGLLGGSYASFSGVGAGSFSGTAIDPQFLAETTGPTPGTSFNFPVGIFVQGRYAYVVNSTGNALDIIDISNPASPTFVSQLQDNTKLAGAYGLFVSGKYAYITTLTRKSLAVVDISNPSSPQFVGEYTSSTVLGQARVVFVSGNYAFVTGSQKNALFAIDVSNPANPTLVGSTTTSLSAPRGIYVSGKYAYVANVNNNSLVIDDISNPSSPTFVSQLQDNTKLQSIVDVYVVGRYAYVVTGGSRNSPGTGRNSLAIIDVSNPASPTFVSEVQDDTRLSGSRMVFVSGNYAYVTNNNRDSLAVINIANPSSPYFVAEQRGPVTGPESESGSTHSLGCALGLFVAGNYAYVGTDCHMSLAVIDISGFTASNAQIGTLLAGNLSVDSHAQFSQGVSIADGLNVGGNALVSGVLSVTGTSSPTLFQVANTTSATAPFFMVSSGGNVGIGTTTPNWLLQVTGTRPALALSDTAAGTNAKHWLFSSQGGNLYIGTSTDALSATSTYFTILKGGNVGVGTTSPAHQLTTTGSVQFATFGAGTLQTDANGNLSVSSDERLKNLQGSFDRGLADLEKLSPILYKWKPETGFDASTTYAGFSAQNVQSAIPEAVGQGKDGFLTLQDRPLIAAIVNAIKELGATVVDGVTHFAKLAADKFTTHELCVDDVCVTRDEFLRMREGQTPAAGAPRLEDSVGPPGGRPAPEVPSADTATSTTPANDNQPPAITVTATTTPDISVPSETVPAEVQPPEPTTATEPAPAAANDNPQPQGAEQSSHDGNSPADQLPTTGTE